MAQFYLRLFSLHFSGFRNNIEHFISRSACCSRRIAVLFVDDGVYQFPINTVVGIYRGYRINWLVCLDCLRDSFLKERTWMFEITCTVYAWCLTREDGNNAKPIFCFKDRYCICYIYFLCCTVIRPVLGGFTFLWDVGNRLPLRDLKSAGNQAYFLMGSGQLSPTTPKLMSLVLGLGWSVKPSSMLMWLGLSCTKVP